MVHVIRVNMLLAGVRTVGMAVALGNRSHRSLDVRRLILGQG